MEPVQDPVTAYYNNNRKRSFFYSRATVITSMFVLVIALVLNISLLYSQDKSTVQSHASTPDNPEKNLPKLPPGCSYQQTKDGMVVACPTPTPTGGAGVPIDIVLPQLPPQCHLETTTKGSSIMCTTIFAPIPTVPVMLPSACATTKQADIVACQSHGEMIQTPLPSLPVGCLYQKVANKYYVVCKAS